MNKKNDIHESCTRCYAITEMLDNLEIELIALKDIRDIIVMIPVENPTPPYLIQRIEAHIDKLDEVFLRIQAI